MRIGVGIDPGYENCGLVWMDLTARRIVDHQTIHTARAKTLTKRMFLLHRELALALSRRGVEAVGYESPYRVGKAKQVAHKTNYNPLLLMLVVGHIQSLCWEHGIVLYEHEPGEVKRAVVPGRGAGSADKAQVRRAVEAIYGLKLSEHEADAAGAATVTCRKWSLDRRLAEAQA